MEPEFSLSSAWAQPVLLTLWGLEFGSCYQSYFAAWLCDIVSVCLLLIFCLSSVNPPPGSICINTVIMNCVIKILKRISYCDALTQVILKLIRN